MTRILLAAALLPALTLPAAAGFYSERIAGAMGEPPCYARLYTPEHLASHPRQRLTAFVLSESRYEQAPLPAGEFALTFAFQLKGNDDVFQSEAICTDAAGAEVHCFVEGDGGDFTLRATAEGLMWTVGERVEVEGASSFSPDLAVGGDDRQVRLFPGPAEACNFE